MEKFRRYVHLYQMALTFVELFMQNYHDLDIQWVPQLFEQLVFFHVNKSCKIECCGNKMHQIVQNMIMTRGLVLKSCSQRKSRIFP